MQILVKQFIVDPQGNIIDCILNPPFAFLQNLVEELSNIQPESRRSTQIFVGALRRIELLDIPVEQFFALIRFKDRDKLIDLIKLT